MKTYLVGGAIRDRLLGLEPKERDWVVVGSTPSEMRSKGFKQVGKDFLSFFTLKQVKNTPWLELKENQVTVIRI